MTDVLPDALAAYQLSKGTVDFLGQSRFGHFLGSDVLPGANDETIAVFDPSSGQEIGRGAIGTAEEVDRAVRLAAEAFDDGRWRDLRPAEKERRLHAFADLIAEHAGTLSELDTLDAGIHKTFTSFYMNLGVEMIHYFAGWPTKLEGSIPSVEKNLAVSLQREPLGVCGMIVPWNGPAIAAVFPVVALAAGNSIVFKPAEQTPMSALFISHLYVEAGIPPGVFNVIQGDGLTGGALVAHPGVAKISFTGSVETGQRIQAAAAATLKQVDLELGGKSPHIIFADADIEAAAAAAAGGVWNNSGQVCTAGTRVLVERVVHDDVVAAVVERSRGLRLGGAFDPASEMGPLISAEQLDRVEAYVEIGRQEGAEVVLGGHRVGDAGYFFEPTVFTGVSNDMRIAQEEIFGPVMAVVPFDSEDEAFRIANDTKYGLSAGVWTTDLARAHRAARAIRSGTVWVNTYQEVESNVPYGGVKSSGHGRNLGKESIEAFLQTKSVWMRLGTG